MHIHTLWHRHLLQAAAWATFAALEWSTRRQVFATLQELALQGLVEANGQAERARIEVQHLTGSPALGEAAQLSLGKWLVSGG
jgi:hypothetical protein